MQYTSEKAPLNRRIIDYVYANDKGSVALEYIIISLFATAIALASMTYIQTLVNAKLESFEAELEDSEINVRAD